MQSKKHSAIETVTNTAIGFFGSWLIIVLVLKYLPGSTMHTATVTTALCTVWSIVRGYVLRRVFARFT